MVRVSETVWGQLVAEWEAAEHELDDARVRYDAIPLAENDSPKTPEEEAYDRASEAADRLADQLLGVEAPSSAAAALQLRIFAQRHHDVDLAGAPQAGEDREAVQLRTIYAGLVRQR